MLRTSTGSQAFARKRVRRRSQGYTLVELMMAVAAAGVLAWIGIGSYLSFQNQRKVAAACTDIGYIHAAIDSYTADNSGTLPPDLATVGFATKLDPWGNPYVYQPLTNVQGKGIARKDKNLVPINTLYDLYSKGADGASVGPLTAAVSRDDVIMANDGGYIGLASGY